MKSINAIVFTMFCGFLIGCNKPLPDYSHQPFDYSVTGISDISVAANSSVFLTGSVHISAGFAENQLVKVSFKGLPANVFLKSDSFSFLLNYEISDSLSAANATPGVYPMQAVFENASAGTKVYSFNLKVTPPVDRTADVIGYYYPSNSCGSGIYVSCEIDAVGGTPGKIMIIDRISPSDTSYGTFDTCYGYVNCCDNTFIIPAQIVQGTTVSGDGSYNYLPAPDKEVLINRTYTKGTSSYQCTVSLFQR